MRVTIIYSSMPRDSSDYSFSEAYIELDSEQYERLEKSFSTGKYSYLNEDDSVADIYDFIYDTLLVNERWKKYINSGRDLNSVVNANYPTNVCYPEQIVILHNLLKIRDYTQEEIQYLKWCAFPHEYSCLDSYVSDIRKLIKICSPNYSDSAFDDMLEEYDEMFGFEYEEKYTVAEAAYVWV